MEENILKTNVEKGVQTTTQLRPCLELMDSGGDLISQDAHDLLCSHTRDTLKLCSFKFELNI